MATDLRGHTVPAAGDNPSRAALTTLAMSVRDPIPVANATARAALIVSLAAASPAVVPSTSNPVFVFRADATAGGQLEVTVDGTNWRTCWADDLAWTAPTLGNSWVTPGPIGAAYQVAGFRKVGGEVEMRGLIGSGTTSTTIFTLPAGARPALREIFLCAANAGAAQLEVRPDGVVTVIAYIASGTNVLVSLAGVRFSYVN